MSLESCKVITFAPQNWGTMERFQHFYSTTYKFDPHTQSAVSGASNHLRKASLVLQVAKEHAATLAEDEEQLSRHGYTPARRAKELAALIESIILGVYSSVDCARQVVTYIYRKHRGVKQSTRKFFQAAAAGKVANTVPSDIRAAFKSATWYVDLRRLRDALTHSDVGFCHLDKSEGKVTYMHAGLGSDSGALVIPDIFDHIDTLLLQINQFMGRVFHCLNQTLNDGEVWQVCGMFAGRVYSRWVRPSHAVDFNSGRCDAFKWFEKEDSLKCPFMNNCAAYQRTKCK